MAIQKDVIIIGQGVIGSLLAVQLLKMGMRVMVMDDGAHTGATQVAAGLINPLYGKRLSPLFKSKAEEENIWRFYHELEHQIGKPFINYFPMVRRFDANDVLAERQSNSQTAEWFDQKSIIDTTDFDLGQHQFRLEKVMQINAESFLNGIKSTLKAADGFVSANVNVNSVQVSDPFIINGVEAPVLMFCSGAQAKLNPWFNFLEFKNAYGHILDVQINGIANDTIMHHGMWLIPKGRGQFRYGASSFWEDTASNRQQSLASLTKSLTEFVNPAVNVVGHQFGERPILNQREPFCGFHPTIKGMGLVVGLGGHGFAKAPGVTKTMAVKIQQYLSSS